MPVGLTATRPIAAQTEPLTISLIAETPVENDSDDTLRFRVSRQNLTPPTFTQSIAIVAADATITAPSGQNFSKLRPGDAIAGTGVSGNIVSVDTTVTPNTAELSAAATGPTATVDATVTPPQVDVAMLDIKISAVVSGSSLQFKIQLHKFDGSGSNDANLDGKDDVLGDSTTLLVENTASFDMDDFLTKARIPRT